MSEPESSFSRLYSICKKLRSPEGCPWDKSQTPLTMRTCLKEEIFEVIDAIEEENPEHAKEELGDAIFNLLLVSLMFQENADFSVADVFNEISDKLVRRHPHVFNKEHSDSDNIMEEKTVNFQWDKIKSEVEGRKTLRTLDSVPKGFEPLLKAYKYLKKASKKGFVWPSVEGAKNKVFEEIEEVQSAENQEQKEEECGDLLLAVVNYCLMNNVDPELALNKANKKFYSRYSYVEKYMEENGFPMNEEHLDQMMTAWTEAKNRAQIE